MIDIIPIEDEELWIILNTFQCPQGKVSPRSCKKIRERGQYTSFPVPRVCENCTIWKQKIKDLSSRREKLIQALLTYLKGKNAYAYSEFEKGLENLKSEQSEFIESFSNNQELGKSFVVIEENSKGSSNEDQNVEKISELWQEPARKILKIKSRNLIEAKTDEVVSNVVPPIQKGRIQEELKRHPIHPDLYWKDGAWRGTCSVCGKPDKRMKAPLKKLCDSCWKKESLKKKNKVGENFEVGEIKNDTVSLVQGDSRQSVSVQPTKTSVEKKKESQKSNKSEKVGIASKSKVVKEKTKIREESKRHPIHPDLYWKDGAWRGPCGVCGKPDRRIKAPLRKICETCWKREKRKKDL